MSISFVKVGEDHVHVFQKLLLLLSDVLSPSGKCLVLVGGLEYSYDLVREVRWASAPASTLLRGEGEVASERPD